MWATKSENKREKNMKNEFVSHLSHLAQRCCGCNWFHVHSDDLILRSENDADCSRLITANVDDKKQINGLSKQLSVRAMSEEKLQPSVSCHTWLDFPNTRQDSRKTRGPGQCVFGLDLRFEQARRKEFLMAQADARCLLLDSILINEIQCASRHSIGFMAFSGRAGNPLAGLLVSRMTSSPIGRSHCQALAEKLIYG
jgi:hypothetical protein